MKQGNLLYLLLLVPIAIVVALVIGTNGAFEETPTITVTSTTTALEQKTETVIKTETVTTTISATTEPPTTTTSEPPTTTTTTEPPTTTTSEPPTTTTSIQAPPVSAENHAGQTDDSFCAMCHGADTLYPYPADHEGRTDGCLADGCHTLPE